MPVATGEYLARLQLLKDVTERRLTVEIAKLRDAEIYEMGADEVEVTFAQQVSELTAQNIVAFQRAIIGINSAIKRIEDGIYGTCYLCHMPISDARLDAMPTALLCINCAKD